VTKEQELKLDRNRKKFDIREEYFVRQSDVHTLSDSMLSEKLQKLSAQAEEEWEPRRIPRPKGVPEWGVPPTEPPPKSSEPLSKAF
jgi:cytochrome c oxidase assembly protein subunit 16